MASSEKKGRYLFAGSVGPLDEFRIYSLTEINKLNQPLDEQEKHHE